MKRFYTIQLLIALIFGTYSNSVFSESTFKAKKSLTWKDAPGEANKGTRTQQLWTRDRQADYPNVIKKMDHKNNVYQFFQLECDSNNVCTTKQNYFMRNRYKRLSEQSINVGQCFIKSEEDKTFFFKVSEKKKQFIEAIVEIVSNNTKYANILYRKNFVFNDETFNSDLEQFPCDETPSLWNTAYVSDCIRDKNRQKYFCNTEFFRRFRSPAKVRYK